MLVFNTLNCEISDGGRHRRGKCIYGFMEISYSRTSNAQVPVAPAFIRPILIAPTYVDDVQHVSTCSTSH